MPVKVEALRDLEPESIRQGSLASRALAFLREHEGDAYRLVELANELGVEMTSLSPSLTRLSRLSLLKHEKGHWYATPDREVARRQATRLGNRHANAKLGREKPEDWPRIPRDP